MTTQMERNLATFEAQHPDIAAWWANTWFEFALSLKNQVITKGFLSEKQLAAAKKCVSTLAAKKAESAAREAAAPAVDVTQIEKAFAKGNDAGLTRPKMRLSAEDGEAYAVSMAPAHGKNAGALYVKRIGDDTYMGKIFQGRFIGVSVCSAIAEAAIVEACGNPERSAVKYGRVFGSCSCCGRTLTNQESIDLGIGPICRGKFF